MKDKIAYIDKLIQKKQGDPITLIVDCPYCGKQHQHGGGSDSTQTTYGNRMAHCIGETRRLSYDISVDKYTVYVKR